MAALAWLVAPALAGLAQSARRFTQALIAALCAGLVWQFLLVVILVAGERRSLCWLIVRDALWLRPPSTQSRRGGLLWLWGGTAVRGRLLCVAARAVAPTYGREPRLRCVPRLGSGAATLHGNWGLFAVIVVMFVFNTVLGRGVALPGPAPAADAGCFRPAGLDRLAGIDHGWCRWYAPKSIPLTMLVGLLLAYPSKRFRSAWLGILIHSTQSVYLLALLFVLVLHHPSIDPTNEAPPPRDENPDFGLSSADKNCTR